ncbi:MAG TPA: serine hydrolase domain-containing protein [Acidisarcina sp.]|nr:serine hydrolase domain-containing protein [Acidisarcina sp.]
MTLPHVRHSIAVLLLAAFSGSLHAQAVDTLPADLRSKIDAVAAEVLEATGVPSASLAVVKDGKVAYTHAYGLARLSPPLSAEPSMRYSIGSISKQFTAAALLLLQQDGKLKLDDPVAKYLPGLTRANEITLRMLLSHTSGYQDYWPEDYVMTPMLEPVTSKEILDTWAKKPLDFDPGTKWQYSNTNYVIAGVIIEQVSGMPVLRLLQTRVFTPLEMKSVYNTDEGRLPAGDATGYYRHALGPLRPSPKEGKGWMFAAGELAMPAYDLALWDISLMNRSLLAATSYQQMFDEAKLKDGGATGYALGIQVSRLEGHLLLEHSGEVSGFVSDNLIDVDNKAAVAVLTNQDAISAASSIARKVRQLLVGQPSVAGSSEETRAAAVFAGLQDGKIDRSLFTKNCNDYFDEVALQDFAQSLKPLGTPESFHQTHSGLRGGMTFRVFHVVFPHQQLTVTTYEMPDKTFEQYLVMPAQ